MRAYLISLVALVAFQSTCRCDPLILYAVWIDLEIGYMSESVLMEHLYSVGEILSMTSVDIDFAPQIALTWEDSVEQENN